MYERLMKDIMVLSTGVKDRQQAAFMLSGEQSDEGILDQGQGRHDRGNNYRLFLDLPEHLAEKLKTNCTIPDIVEHIDGTHKMLRFGGLARKKMQYMAENIPENGDNISEMAQKCIYTTSILHPTNFHGVKSSIDLFHNKSNDIPMNTVSIIQVLLNVSIYSRFRDDLRTKFLATVCRLEKIQDCEKLIAISA